MVGLVVTFAAGLLLVRAAQRALHRLCRAVRRDRRGLRHSVHRPLQGGALRPRRLHGSAAHVRRPRSGRPLALAALATMAGFYAFLPTRVPRRARPRRDRRHGDAHRLRLRHHRAAGAAGGDPAGGRARAGRLQVPGAGRRLHRAAPLRHRHRHAGGRARRHAAAAQPVLRLQPAQPRQPAARRRSPPWWT